MQLKYRKGRANGGHLIHLVNMDTFRAVCGHRPKNTKGALFRRAKCRAKWLVPHDEDAPVTCKGCLAKGINPKLES